uniref:A-type allatostatin n=1 Tax=Amphibalanus amphitrite TaxID=1232801 RepID=I3VN92_AMPAM|nr:A-type allatostatin [Amphibalanus amphitrite]
MMSCRLMLATLLALATLVTPHSVSAKQLGQDHQLATDLLDDNYDDTYDLEPDGEDVEKRDRTYGFGLGKRDQNRPYRAYGFGLGKRGRPYSTYGFGLGKRERTYGFGLGKRERTYGFGLGKRQPSYAFGLGKRPSASQYAFGLGKRNGHDDIPNKRPTYGFGLGKRSWSWFEGPTRDVLKRPSYGFGLGKRSAPAGVDEDLLDDPDTALLLMTAARDLADGEVKSPAGRHRIGSDSGQTHTKPEDVSSQEKGVRFQL